KLGQVACSDVPADFRARHIDERRHISYCNALRQCPNGKGEVDRQCLANLQEQPAPLKVLEACELRRKPVTAGSQSRHKVTAILTSYYFAKPSSLFIGQNNHDTGQHTALFIRDTSTDVCCPLLSKGLRCQRSEQNRERKTGENSIHGRLRRCRG